MLSLHSDHRITSLYVRCVLPEPDNLLIEARVDDAYWRPDDYRSIRNEFKLCSSCVFQKMGAWCGSCDVTGANAGLPTPWEYYRANTGVFDH